MTCEPQVVVVPTGTANLASVRAGLERAGAAVRLARSAAEVRTAPRVVLPGVGAFARAMERLEADGTGAALGERIAAGTPLLAICLGLQLLTEGSDESPGVPGLGAVPGTAIRFPGSVPVPQLGWNLITPDRDCTLLEPGHAYFANSYRLERAPAGWRCAHADHGGRFVAALERGGVLACQFHPELSGGWGIALLQRWLGTGPQGGAAC